MIVPIIFLLQLHIFCSYGSNGDRSPYFQRCVNKCSLQNCTLDGIHLSNGNEQTFINALLMWSCNDECVYECMWKTVKEFTDLKWNVPQFYGKWPFVRIFGLQEAASTIFSLLNLYYVIKYFLKFRKNVDCTSPMYKEWTLFSYININAWIWSAVFHARDFVFTEKMDYIGSFSLIYFQCYCLVCRLLKDSPRHLRMILKLAFVLFFLNYVASIALGSIDYRFNMILNIFVGMTAGLVWFMWSIYNRKKQPYVIKMATFVTLASLTVLLEIFDYPPIFYIIDFHSLFHLASAPLIPLLYSFIIDDCQYLKKEEDSKSIKKPV